MQNIFLKILTTKKTVIPRNVLDSHQAEVVAVGKELSEGIKKVFRGSLAIRQVDAGSDNACEQELTALSNAYYDVERFGIHFVASPKHADMLLITGPVTRNMADALRRAYENTPDPKIIVAVGDDAINGGIFKGSYAAHDGAHNVVKVDYQIPGDPPTPLEILRHLLAIVRSMDKK